MVFLPTSFHLPSAASNKALIKKKHSVSTLDLIHCKKKNMAAHFCWDSLMTFSQLPVLGILCWASLQALQKSALLARISLLCTPSSVAEMQAVPRKFDSYSTTTNTYTTQDSLSSIRELALYYSRGAHEPGYCLDEYLHMLCSSRWVASQKTQFFSTCSISDSKMLSFIQNALCYMQELGKFSYRPLNWESFHTDLCFYTWHGDKTATCFHFR